jgi:Lsr2
MGTGHAGRQHRWADETVRFGIGNAEYEIDLSEKNAAKLRQRFAPFVEHARKPAKGQSRPAARTAASRQHSADIRAWAAAQGIAISERGRIPATVVTQYEAASQGR